MIGNIILFMYVYFAIGLLYLCVAMIVALDYFEELEEKLAEKYDYLDNAEFVVAASIVLFYPIYTIALLILGIALCCKYLKYTIEVIKLMFKD